MENVRNAVDLCKFDQLFQRLISLWTMHNDQYEQRHFKEDKFQLLNYINSLENTMDNHLFICVLDYLNMFFYKNNWPGIKFKKDEYKLVDTNAKKEEECVKLIRRTLKSKYDLEKENLMIFSYIIKSKRI